MTAMHRFAETCCRLSTMTGALLLLTASLCLPSSCLGQGPDIDTLHFSRAVRGATAVRPYWLPLLHHRPGQDVIATVATLGVGLAFHWRGVYLSSEGAITGFQPRRGLLFRGIPLDEKTTGFHSLDLNLVAGYEHRIGKRFVMDFRIGANNTRMWVTRPVFINTTLKSEAVTGLLLGVGATRYVRLRGFIYTGLGARVDYCSTDHTRISPDLGRSSLVYSLVFSYKFWSVRFLD